MTVRDYYFSTNDAALNHRLLNPSLLTEREYWVQVDGDINEKAIQELQRGVSITINGARYNTKPCKATRFTTHRKFPIEIHLFAFAKRYLPAGFKIDLNRRQEPAGTKNDRSNRVPNPSPHQVQKLADITLDGLLPGEMRELNKNDIYARLFG